MFSSPMKNAASGIALLDILINKRDLFLHGNSEMQVYNGKLKSIFNIWNSVKVPVPFLINDGDWKSTKWKFFPICSSILVLLTTIFVGHLIPGSDGQGSPKGKFVGHRQAPFCVDDTITEPVEDGLYYFADIFEFHRNNSYIPVSNGETSPSGLIKSFKLSGIQVDDKDSGYKSVLHNWVHIDVEAAVELEGFYIQAISAPWGTPFGEFVTDFDCSDCGEKPSSFYQSGITIIPCLYRSAIAYTHPNVLTFGGQRVWQGSNDDRTFTHLHFNFRYTQYPCAEHTFAQFLIIAVRDFRINASRFETYFSPIYEMKIDDNPMGSYYPFYYGWSTKYIKCHEKDVKEPMEKVSWPQSSAGFKYKIRMSPGYEKCLQTRAGNGWYTCSPGPVSMKEDEIPMDLANWQKLRKSYALLTNDGANPGGNDVADTVGAGVQFCPDAGTWEWMLGSATWTLPVELQIEEGSIEAGAYVKGEDDQYSKDIAENFDCKNKTALAETTEASILRICASEGAYSICKDVHLTECDNIIDIPAPTYGKGLDGKRVDKSWDNMSFSEQFDDIDFRWGEKYVLVLHGKLLIFSVTVGFNIMAFVARYLKEGEEIKQRSSYFGIGSWLWIHMGVTYLMITSALAGFFLLAHQNYKTGQNDTGHINGPRDLCNVCPTLQKTNLCLKTVGHRYFGGMTVMLFMLSYLASWKRPETRGLRNIKIVYHIVCAYLSKIFGIGSIIFSIKSVKTSTIAYITMIEISSITMMVLAEVLLRLIDRRLNLTRPRKVFPVIEGIDIVPTPAPYGIAKRLLLPCFALVQISLYVMMVVQHYYKIHDNLDFSHLYFTENETIINDESQ